jgi:DNA-binding beta-propeller fold protein YncE
MTRVFYSHRRLSGGSRLLHSLGCSALLLFAGCSGGAGGAVSAEEEAVYLPPLGGQHPGADPQFTLFESGQVRPLALSPSGRRLYAINTPDDRLEIFDVSSTGLQHKGSVPVGLEPVAVATRGDDEVWVVNHLSDSVSIVDVSSSDEARVVRTLLVGDEPRDIVFAGPERRRAFITTAHRGQNSPTDPQFFVSGIGRADVWVFDAERLGGSLGGSPLNILTLFTDTPRALAVSSDGSRVYAAGFHTGNRTTVIHQEYVSPGGGTPPPKTNFLGERQPETGLIVKYDGAHWVDQVGRNWDADIHYSLPDRDVFALDAMADPPRQVSGSAGAWMGVGTTLFNMAVNPVNGKVYVTNLDANNFQRFEGAGIHAGSSVRGHLTESRISVLSPGTVAARHLNKHIDYAHCCAALPNDKNARSLAFPQGMAVSGDGATLYVAAFGSSKVGVFHTAQLENDTFAPSTARQITVSGGGPSGVVLDEPHHKLYVMTRFDNGMSVVDTTSRHEIAHLLLYNPEPQNVRQGRPLLYNAAYTSSHGDSACASCHVDGNLDDLAWDLGNPDGTSLANPNPIIPSFIAPDPSAFDSTFRPMKGPMATQSLRGMSNHGPMHWRGDRTGGNDSATAQPDSGAFDEEAAFKKFNPAFESLLGRHEQLTTAEMQDFTDFALQIVYPPNPIRNLDNSLTADQQAGRNQFFTPQSEANGTCADCHTLDPNGNAEHHVRFPGFFGTSGLSVFLTLDPVLPQVIKVPHLRAEYQKVGMFGSPPSILHGGVTTTFIGDQVRGFGLFHDGAGDSLPSFFTVAGFSQPISPHGFVPGPQGDLLREQVAKFILAFDSNLKPVVGQQVTLTHDNPTVVSPRLDLLVARAAAGDCELVAKGRFDGREVGFVYDGGSFVPDRSRLPSVSDGALRQLAAVLGHELTYTCVPVGSGRRLGVDADLDGYLDGDELAFGSNPRDANSTP